MPTYSADEIIGKNLVAIKAVKLYRGADLNTPIYTVAPGANIGTVYSYLNSNAQRPFLYWQFKDSNGNFYYARHIAGEMKLEKFSGAMSLEDKEAAEAAANETTADKITKTVTKVLLGAGLFYLAATAIKSSNEKN